MKARPLPSQEYLRECFDYAPETGDLRWRERPLTHFVDTRARTSWNARYARRRAGTENARRQTISIGNIRHLSYRIIWKLVTGNDPVEIDHRDRDPLNNRWSNLRDATRSRNNANIGVKRTNRLHMKGVRLRATEAGKSRFHAQITIEGRSIFLGAFDTPDAARTAYIEAARKRWGEFAASE